MRQVVLSDCQRTVLLVASLGTTISSESVDKFVMDKACWLILNREVLEYCFHSVLSEYCKPALVFSVLVGGSDRVLGIIWWNARVRHNVFRVGRDALLSLVGDRFGGFRAVSYRVDFGMLLSLFQCSVCDRLSWWHAAVVCAVAIATFVVWMSRHWCRDCCSKAIGMYRRVTILIITSLIRIVYGYCLVAYMYLGWFSLEFCTSACFARCISAGFARVDSVYSFRTLPRDLSVSAPIGNYL